MVSACKPDHELDATGLKCPMPVLRARRALKPLQSGERLLVQADDPASVKDFPAFCEMTGAVLERSDEETGPDGPVYLFLIRKP